MSNGKKNDIVPTNNWFSSPPSPSSKKTSAPSESGLFSGLFSSPAPSNSARKGGFSSSSKKTSAPSNSGLFSGLFSSPAPSNSAKKGGFSSSAKKGSTTRGSSGFLGKITSSSTSANLKNVTTPVKTTKNTVFRDKTLKESITSALSGDFNQKTVDVEATKKKEDKIKRERIVVGTAGTLGVVTLGAVNNFFRSQDKVEHEAVLHMNDYASSKMTQKNNSYSMTQKNNSYSASKTDSFSTACKRGIKTKKHGLARKILFVSLFFLFGVLVLYFFGFIPTVPLFRPPVPAAPAVLLEELPPPAPCLSLRRAAESPATPLEYTSSVGLRSASV